MGWTLVQSAGGCPQGCGGTIGTPTCVSRETSGTLRLRGWSKMQNENSGDWNQRKYKALSQTGTTAACVWGDSGCTSILRTSAIAAHSGSSTWDPSANTYATLADIDYEYSGTPFGSPGSCEENPGASSGTLNQDVATEPTLTCSSGSLVTTRAESLALQNLGSSVATASPREFSMSSDTDFTKPLIVSGCFDGFRTDCSGPPSIFYMTLSGDVSCALSDADTVADSQIRAGGITTGSSCKTVAGTITSTTAGTKTQITVTGTNRSVVATIPLTGLTPSAFYDIDININRYTAGGGGLVDAIVVTVNFAATGASEDLDYDVPVNTDYDYEFVSAENLVPA